MDVVIDSVASGNPHASLIQEAKNTVIDAWCALRHVSILHDGTKEFAVLGGGMGVTFIRPCDDRTRLHQDFPRCWRNYVSRPWTTNQDGQRRSAVAVDYFAADVAALHPVTERVLRRGDKKLAMGEVWAELLS